MGVAGAASAPPSAVNLLATVDGVDALVVDAGHVAWLREGACGPRLLRLVDLRTRRVRPVLLRRARCGEGALQGRIALSGSRVLFERESHSIHPPEQAVTAYAADAAAHRVREVGFIPRNWDPESEGSPAPFPSPIAGAGRLLLWASVEGIGDGLYDRIAWRVGKRRNMPLPQTYGVTELTAGDGLFALMRHVAAGCTCNGDPSWSPDGSRIAFLSGRDEGETRRFYLISADGSGLRAAWPVAAGGRSRSPDAGSRTAPGTATTSD